MSAKGEGNLLCNWQKGTKFGDPPSLVPCEQTQDPLCPSNKRAALQSDTGVPGGKQGRPTQTKLN